MAEIEFKRRGTPLWTVLLALVVIAGIVWFVLSRRHSETTATTTAPAAGVATDSMTKAAEAKGLVPQTAPATAGGPSAKLWKWVSTAKMPSDAASQTKYIGDGLALLADALQERVPYAGVQVNLVRAMADTLHKPNLPATKYSDAAQSAFFAAAYALKQTNAGNALNAAATDVVVSKPLAQQTEAVEKYFAAAADALRDTIKAQIVVPNTPAPSDSAGVRKKTEELKKQTP